jgi:hypothetical protein
MDEPIQICVDRILPEDMVVRAADAAIAENKANVPVVAPGVGAGPLGDDEIAVVTGKLWQNGKTLRVRFLDGDPEVHARVEQYAHQWSQYANIKFEFGSDPDAEIRISFQHPGSWSYIGTDALSIGKNAPTMNYGWLTPASSDDEYSRVVLHEFGHALGCIHEHQNPVGDIPWDRPAVYRYYMGPPNNWNKEQVDVNLFQKYSRNITQFSQFDPRSIMLYSIPDALTIGDYAVGWNRVLSDMDKQFIGTMYALDSKPVVDLPLGGPAVEASIGQHGEEDLFKFTAQDEGDYMIETEGNTDVVMSLFGPNNQTTLVAADDDSGRDWNAKIATRLRPGTYFVRIRHYRPTGTGTYKIGVRMG